MNLFTIIGAGLVALGIMKHIDDKKQLTKQPKDAKAVSTQETPKTEVKKTVEQVKPDNDNPLDGVDRSDSFDNKQ